MSSSDTEEFQDAHSFNEAEQPDGATVDAAFQNVSLDSPAGFEDVASVMDFSRDESPAKPPSLTRSSPVNVYARRTSRSNANSGKNETVKPLKIDIPGAKLSSPLERKSPVSSCVMTGKTSELSTGFVSVELNEDSQPDAQQPATKWGITRLFMKNKTASKSKPDNTDASLVLKPSECLVKDLGDAPAQTKPLGASKQKMLFHDEEILKRMPFSKLEEERDLLISRIQELSSELIQTLENRELLAAQNSEFKTHVANLLSKTLQGRKTKRRQSELKNYAMNMTVGSYYQTQKK